MPASRASRSAALAACGLAIGRARNGPLSGEAKSSTGSAMLVATSALIQGVRSISTGNSGSAAASWLASFSVSARAAEIRQPERGRPA